MDLRELSRTHMELNMCMLGARSVGKTTIMTAIFDDSRSSTGLSQSKIALTALPDTREELLDRQEALQEVFEDKKDMVEAGIAASSAVHTFNFEMGLLGRTPCVNFNVTDYPGEFMQSQPDFVSNQIANSSVVLIAIDSPYLMEEDAKYNEERNQVSFIYNYLRDNVDAFSNKLIMLVPLKCEKYYYEKRMDELNAKVRTVYANIIDLFKDSANVALVISPILTMGGVEFDYFEMKAGLPIAKYAFVKDNPTYAPMFCVQPMYYMMSFIAQQYDQHRKDAGAIGTILQRIYDVIDKNKELFTEFVALSKFRIIDKFGYSVLNGENLFYK